MTPQDAKISFSKKTLKVRRKITIYSVIGIVSLVFQLMGYLGNWIKGSSAIFNEEQSISYNIGYNFFLFFAIVSFVNAQSQKKKFKKLEQQELIDSIGN